MDYEPRAREQVPLLLDLGQEVPALLKAMESGDTDLIYTVLLKMHTKMPTLADFYVGFYPFEFFISSIWSWYISKMKSSLQLKIRNYPLAQSLYIKYCYENNNKELHDIYSQESDFNAEAALHLKDAYLPKVVIRKRAYELYL